LTGCATPDPIIQTQTEIQRIPAALLTPCVKSTLSGKTYQDAIELAIARGKELSECAQRIEDIRAWSAK